MIVVEGWEALSLSWHGTGAYTHKHTHNFKSTQTRTHPHTRARAGSLSELKRRRKKCATLGASFKGGKVEEDRRGRTKGRLGWKHLLRYFCSHCKHMVIYAHKWNKPKGSATRLFSFFWDNIAGSHIHATLTYPDRKLSVTGAWSWLNFRCKQNYWRLTEVGRWILSLRHRTKRRRLGTSKPTGVSNW